jgi:hypothetical protein
MTFREELALVRRVAALRWRRIIIPPSVVVSPLYPQERYRQLDRPRQKGANFGSRSTDTAKEKPPEGGFSIQT